MRLLRSSFLSITIEDPQGRNEKKTKTKKRNETWEGKESGEGKKKKREEDLPTMTLLTGLFGASFFL
jgi:hypothetical protein